MPDNKSIIVVGGGWAGLSCAVQLTDSGHQVTLLESARQLGGRARRVAFEEQPVDNGQHLLIGAYHETLNIFKRLNIETQQHLDIQPLDLHLQYINGKHFRLRLSHAPTPLNLFFGLLAAEGFSLRDRWRAFRFGLRLFSNAIILDEDISVEKLLASEKQTHNTITALWEPICLASLNTPIEEASARVLVRVLHDTFCRSATDADLMVPKVDLGTLFPDPAVDFIEQNGGNVHLNQRVTAIQLEQRHITGVTCVNNSYTAEHVVLAIPPYACQTLLKEHAALHDVAYNLSGYSYHPICTIYLKFPANVKPDRPVQAMLGSTAQWIIDRRITGQKGLVSVVISGPGPHMLLDNDALAERIKQEIRDFYPHWPEPDDVMIIREKRATFNCRVGIDLLRPDNRSRVQGLWFAGDFTRTGYPATIEGAIRSGVQTAKLIHNELVNS